MRLCSMRSQCRRTLFCTFLALAAACSPARAQISTAAALGAMTQQDAEARTASIQMKVAQVEASAELDADTKAKVLDRYKSALRSLAEIAASNESAARFENDAKQAAANATSAQRDLAASLRKPAVGPLATQSLADLDAERATREPQVSVLKQQLAGIDAERKTRNERRTAIRRAQAEAESRRAELRKQAEVGALPGEPPVLTDARREDSTLKLLAFDRAMTAMSFEWAKYEAEESVDLLRHRERQIQAELAREEVAVRRLTDVANERRQKEAADKIEKARRQSVLANPLLQPLAEDNRKDAERNAALSQTIAEIDATAAQTHHDAELLDRRFSDIKTKELAVGLTRPIGLMLREQRARFPDLAKFEKELEDRQTLIEEVQVDIWKYDALIAELPDAADYVARRAAEERLSEDTLAAFGGELERTAAELLQSRRELLAEAKQLKQQYFDALNDLDFEDRLYLRTGREYLHYIDERILWTRSADPLTVESVRDDRDSRAWLLSFANWRGTARALAADPIDHPFAFWPTLVAVAALFYVRMRIRPRLRALGNHATKKGFLRYGPTAQSAVLTLMSAVTAPAVLLFLSWRLAEAVDPNGFSRSVAAALEICAAVLFPVELLREACRHMGLAEAHFMWPGRAVRHLRHSLTWMKTLGLPVTFLAVLSHYHSPLEGGVPTERVLFIAGMVLAALTVHRLLGRRSELSVSFLAEQPASLFARFRPLWYGIVVTVPLGFAGLSAAGYHYSATQVATRLLWTLWLAAAGVLIRAMAVRWVVLSRRRLLLNQLQLRRAAEDPQDGSGKPVVVEETDVAKTTAQTRKLVDIVMLGFAATGLAMIWADTLPAIGLLDQPLWTVAEPGTAEPAAAASRTASLGTEPNSAASPSGLAGGSTASESPARSVTPLDLAIAVLTAAFTLLASRNLPGLIEMSVLARLPVDQATRYAVTRLASYTIVIVGLLMASNHLGLRWQNVQWLAAGLTVGLGFGLQEVFANFISGLIVLFERPVRVGDVVTIDDVTGTVTKIRMRATTITNGDRKEFIVPNKEFITGRVLNWTLSDAVNRITVRIGVAYGTDPDQARDILLRIAAEHPLVLKEPASSATLEGFGDSTLNFVLQCYLPSLDLRSDMTHELHARIVREFHKSSIEVAFPQRDLHIRSIGGLTLPLPVVAHAASRRTERPSGDATAA